MKLRGIMRIGCLVLASIVGAVVAYVVIGMALSLISVNGNAVQGGDVIVYLENNGVHTDIVAPVKTERIDWSKVAPPDDTAGKMQRPYLAFGWGAQDFYLNFPSWSDVLWHPWRTLCIVPRAISGLGGTALHVRYVYEPSVGADCRRLVLSASQYDVLVKYILESGRRNDAGCFIRIPHDGYGRNDAFYKGVSRYSPFFTCNTWANSALKACGQKCCLWTFLPHPIFWKYRQAGVGACAGGCGLDVRE